MISFTTFVFTVAIGLLVFYLFFRPKGKFPKGPTAYPIVGNLLQMRGNQYIKFLEWAKEYGPIFQVKFGSARCYVLSDFKLVKEVFNDPDLNDRPHNEVLEMARDGPHGVASASGAEWAEQRRFTLRHLRDFGFGKKTAEELIIGELNEYVDNLAENLGKPVTVNRTFNLAILNTLWMITTGKRYKQDDPAVWRVFAKLQELQKVAGRNPAIFVAPYLAKLLPELLGWNTALKAVQGLKDTLKEITDEHLETYDEDSPPRDFQDAYIREIRNTKDKNSSFYGDAGVTSLRATMADFFVAGSETVTLTLSWAILYLTKFPEKQKKLQEEMDRVVGKNREPVLADRPSLPYAEATITEVLRRSSLVPFGLFHVAAKDSKILGFDCPKGTQILSNNFHIHHNPEFYPNPMEFKPERFLVEDGKKFKKPDVLLAFGSGKRQCLGETLARDELFLFLTNIFHRFDLRLDGDADLVPTPSIILAPKDYQVIITERA